MSPLILFAKYIRDLLSVDEALIRIGRHGFERESFDSEYIVIDMLGKFTQVGSLETYDSATEILSLGAVWSGIVTVDFFGDAAYSKATSFSLLSRSQTAYELKRALGIAIYHSTGPTDLKMLTGQQYGERQQIEMKIEVSSQASASTLRIDTAQTDIRSA